VTDDMTGECVLNRGLRSLTLVVDLCLRVVATVMPLVVQLDLVTQIEGRCLGVVFLTLLAVSMTLFCFANQPRGSGGPGHEVGRLS
jgi:hypothetical protein